MCLPLPMLKVYTTVGAFFTLVIGVLMLGLSVYGFMHSDAWVQDASATKNGFLIAIIISDILIIVGSVLGILGVKRGIPCLLFIFTIIVVVFSIVFGTIGIVAKFLPNIVMPADGCESTTNATWIQDINQLYNSTLTINLCNSLCPCNLQDQTFSAYSPLDQASIKIFYPGNNFNGTNLQLQTCTAYKLYIESLYPSLWPLTSSLGSIEELVKCTGWCPSTVPSDYLFYKYSNVNNGKPEGFCYPKLRDYVVNYSHVAMIACLVTCGALVLVCLCNMCICCHPDRRGEKWSRRFDYGQQQNMGFNNNNYYQRSY